MFNIYVTNWSEEVETILGKFADLGGIDMFDDKSHNFKLYLWSKMNKKDEIKHTHTRKLLHL